MSYIGNEPIVSATRTVTEAVATAGQTTFTPSGGYTVGFLDVIVNGSTLQISDYTATDGSTVVLASPCVSGDDVRLVAYGTFASANSYTQSQVDSGFAAKKGNGAMIINSQTITSDTTLAATENAVSAGTITIATGVTVTQAVGSNWVIV